MHSRLYVVLWILVSVSGDVNAIRAKRSSQMDDDLIIHTEYVDKRNHTILAMFNLTEEQINRIVQNNNANDKNSSAEGPDSQRFDGIKQHRIQDIKNRLITTFDASNSKESQEHPLHEIAAYPICNSESTETSWMQDNNVTIRFADSVFESKGDDLNLDSAILRLYKVNPNGQTDDTYVTQHGDNSKTKGCNDPMMQISPQIRVTVSIVQQQRRNKRERKKRICNTVMMNVLKTGWVEIDIKRAIYIWKNVERQQQQPQARQQPILVGWLMIEVHDEEERPLKPGLFFKPPKCSQADFAIPWNYYGPHTSRSPYAANEVPRYPRLDVKLTGYASFVSKNHNKEFYDKLRRDLRHQLQNASIASSSSEVNTQESTTAATSTADNLISPSESTELFTRHPRKRHSGHSNLHYSRTHHHKSASDADEAIGDHLHQQSAEPVAPLQEITHHQHNRHQQHHKHHNNHHQQHQQFQHQHQHQHHQRQREQEHEYRQQHAQDTQTTTPLSIDSDC